MNNISSRQQNLWSPSIRDLSPYQPGEQATNASIIKLNTNENPYPPSPHVIEAIHQLIGKKADILRLYPDPDALNLRSIISQQYNLSIDHVFVGNGSDEVLSLIFKAFFQHPHKPVLFPDISYSFYPVYTQFYELEYKAIPVTDHYEICIDDYIQENAGIIIANPNAPTGIALELSQIKKLLESNPNSVVVIDEAYVDFGAESAIELIQSHENLVVCQTTSKSRSLAGLRVGYALAQPHLIQALNIVKNSFNSFPVDCIALAAATAAFQDAAYFEEICSKIVQERTFLIQQLQEIGFSILPSQANFIFAKHRNFDAAELHAQLKKHHILVRYFNKPRISQFLRISVGTHSDHLSLIECLKQIIK